MIEMFWIVILQLSQSDEYLLFWILYLHTMEEMPLMGA